MPPTWLTVLAWTSLASAFACAGLIAVDIFVRGYRQHVRIKDVVWALTALYSGPPWWLAYGGNVSAAALKVVARARRVAGSRALAFESFLFAPVVAALRTSPGLRMSSSSWPAWIPPRV